MLPFSTDISLSTRMGSARNRDGGEFDLAADVRQVQGFFDGGAAHHDHVLVAIEETVAIGAALTRRGP